LAACCMVVLIVIPVSYADALKSYEPVFIALVDG